MKAKNDPNNNVFRVNRVFLKKIRKLWLDTTVESEQKIDMAEVINAIIYKHVENTKPEDVIEYRTEILGKEY